MIETGFSQQYKSQYTKTDHSAVFFVVIVVAFLNGCGEAPKESTLPIPGGCEKYFQGAGAKREVIIANRDNGDGSQIDVRLHYSANYLYNPYPIGPRSVSRQSSENFLLKLSDGTAFDPKQLNSKEGRNSRRVNNYPDEVALSVADYPALTRTFVARSTDFYEVSIVNPNYITTVFPKVQLAKSEYSDLEQVTSNGPANMHGTAIVYVARIGQKVSDYMVCNTLKRRAVVENCTHKFYYRELSISIRYSKSELSNHTELRKRAEAWLACTYVEDMPTTGKPADDAMPMDPVKEIAQ